MSEPLQEKGEAMSDDKLKRHLPIECCNYSCPTNIPYPVMWNPFNKVVQCHNCGQVWQPKNTRTDDLALLVKALNVLLNVEARHYYPIKRESYALSWICMFNTHAGITGIVFGNCKF